MTARIGYFGKQGSFSHLAATRRFPQGRARRMSHR